MFEKARRLDYTVASSWVIADVWQAPTSWPETLAATQSGLRKRQFTCVKALERKRWTCENLIIYTLEKMSTQEMPFVGLFICSFSTRGKEEKTGKEAEGVWEVLSCRRKEERQWVVDRRGERGGNHLEEPSCDNRPTGMHRCECTLVSQVTLPPFKQINPVLYRLLQKPSNFLQDLFTAVTFFGTHVQCISMSHVWLPQIPFGWCENLLFFSIFSGSDSSNKTAYCTLTDKHTDRHKYTEQIQRDRKREKEKGRGQEADFDRRACRQVTWSTLGRWQ